MRRSSASCRRSVGARNARANRSVIGLPVIGRARDALQRRAPQRWYHPRCCSPSRSRPGTGDRGRRWAHVGRGPGSGLIPAFMAVAVSMRPAPSGGCSIGDSRTGVCGVGVHRAGVVGSTASHRHSAAWVGAGRRHVYTQTYAHLRAVGGFGKPRRALSHVPHSRPGVA